KTSIPMPGHPLTGQQCRPADPANGRRRAVVGETDPLAGEMIQTRCLNDRIASTAKRIVPPVIRIKEKDIQRSFGHRASTETKENRQRSNDQNTAQERESNSHDEETLCCGAGIIWLTSIDIFFANWERSASRKI